jgi:BON domain
VRALEWDAFVPTDRIDVTVSKGWVTLKGEVEWQCQKDDAERVVRRLAGVRGRPAALRRLRPPQIPISLISSAVVTHRSTKPN